MNTIDTPAGTFEVTTPLDLLDEYDTGQPARSDDRLTSED